jgi:hypothetical protein
VAGSYEYGNELSGSTEGREFLDSLGVLLVFRRLYSMEDRLCGLVVSVADYKHRGPGFDSRALLRIFLRDMGMERGPLSLVIG